MCLVYNIFLCFQFLFALAGVWENKTTRGKNVSLVKSRFTAIHYAVRTRMSQWHRADQRTVSPVAEALKIPFSGHIVFVLYLSAARTNASRRLNDIRNSPTMQLLLLQALR